MTKATTTYEALKGQAYGLATIAAGRNNPEAAAEGFRDVYDLIMSDSNNARQPAFVLSLPQVLSDAQRKVLLDGMAREYAGVDGWMAYVDRECEGE